MNSSNIVNLSNKGDNGSLCSDSANSLALIRGVKNYYPDGVEARNPDGTQIKNPDRVQMRKIPFSFSFTRGYEIPPKRLSESCPRSSAPLHLPVTAQPRKRIHHIGAFSPTLSYYYNTQRHNTKLFPSSTQQPLQCLVPPSSFDPNNSISARKLTTLSNRCHSPDCHDNDSDATDDSAFECFLPYIDLSTSSFCDRNDNKSDDVSSKSSKGNIITRISSCSSPECLLTSSTLSHDQTEYVSTSFAENVIDETMEESDETFIDRSGFKVQVRIRPLEEQDGGNLPSRLRCLHLKGKQNIALSTRPSLKKENTKNKHWFKFDHVFDEDSTQKDTYDVTTLPLVENVLKGYHACLIAYGAPATGKSHALYGKASSGKHKGLIIRAAEALITAAEKSAKSDKTSITMSFLQLYNERFYDILDPSATDNIKFCDSGDIHSLDGVTEWPVETSEDVTKQLRRNPNRMRDTGRSHTIFTLHFRKEEELEHPEGGAKMKRFRTIQGRIDFVDLIGVNRHTKHSTHDSTGNNATAKANKSLQIFANVIWALTDKESPNLPYRESKLTRFLQEALGGNCMSRLLVTASPCPNSAHETLSCLLFGKRAMALRNFPIPYVSVEDIEEPKTENEMTCEDEIGRKSNIEDKNSNITFTSIKASNANKATMQTEEYSVISPISSPITNLDSVHSNILPPINVKGGALDEGLESNRSSADRSGTRSGNDSSIALELNYNKCRRESLTKKKSLKESNGDQELYKEKRCNDKVKKAKRKNKNKVHENGSNPLSLQITGDVSETGQQCVILPQISTPEQIRFDFSQCTLQENKRKSVSKPSPLADLGSSFHGNRETSTSSTPNKEDKSEERRNKHAENTQKSNCDFNENNKLSSMLPASTNDTTWILTHGKVKTEPVTPQTLTPPLLFAYDCCGRCQEREEKIKRNYDRMILLSKKDRDAKQSRIEELEVTIQKIHTQSASLKELQAMAEDKIKDRQIISKCKETAEKYQKQIARMVDAGELVKLQELRRQDQERVEGLQDEITILKINLDEQTIGATKMLSKKFDQNNELRSELEASKENAEASQRNCDKLEEKMKNLNTEKEDLTLKYENMLKESSLKLTFTSSQVLQLKEANCDIIKKHEREKEQLLREISIVTKQLSGAASTRSKSQTRDEKLNPIVTCDSSTNTEDIKSRLQGLAYSIQCLRCAAQVAIDNNEFDGVVSLKDTELRILLAQDAKNRELLLQLKRERNLLRDVMKIMYCRQWFTEEGNPHVKRTLRRVGIDTRELAVIKKT